MPRPDQLRLLDISEACAVVELLTARGPQAYQHDPAVRPAIERMLEIIGEAAAALSDETRGRHPDVPWRDLTRLRILLAHHYHRADPDQVWTIAVMEVPRLLRAIS